MKKKLINLKNLLRYKLDILNRHIKVLTGFKSLYTIEKIDTVAQSVIIRLCGTDTIIKLNYHNLISDESILSGLTPEQTCMIGGYFGRHFIAHKENQTHSTLRNFSFLLQKNQGSYYITHLNRDGKIGYINKYTRKEFVEEPITIVNHRHIVSNFDPTQACYIGILAGMNIEKTMRSSCTTKRDKLKKKLDQKPVLRVVK